MSKKSTEGDTTAVVRLTEDALMYSGLILIPGFVGGTILGDRLLQIYGPSFTAGTQVFSLLILAAIVWTFNKQLVNAFNAIDRPDLSFRSNAVFVCSNVLLNFALIYQLSILGAAIATLVSASIALLTSAQYARAQFEIVPPYGEITRQCVAATIMGGIVLWARITFEGYTFPNILIVLLLVCIGAVAYFGILFIISSNFRTTLYHNIPDNPITE